MAKVQQVANAALSNILVQGSEAPLEPDEYQDFIFAMNNFMTDLDAKEIQLGYTIVDSLDDEVTIPPGALRGLIFNMGIESAPQYGGVIMPDLRQFAKDGLETMRKLGQVQATSHYPETLPIGSGNEGELNGNFGYHFYPGEENKILAETTGCISLEVNTNEVAQNG